MPPGNAKAHPSFVLRTFFANQRLAQIEMFSNTANYLQGVHVIIGKLDEKVARLHLKTLGAGLT